jgi:hypothetical protein
MRFSLRLGRHGPRDRSEAWACFSANLGLPGSGSLLAGRVSGYAQVLLALLGLAVTLAFFVEFGLWLTAHWSGFWSPDTDPLERLTAFWQHLRGMLLGVALFGVAWLWALFTGWHILAQVKRGAPDDPARPSASA